MRAENIQGCLFVFLFFFVFFLFSPVYRRDGEAVSQYQRGATTSTGRLLSSSVELPDKLKAVVTLMRKEVWATELEGHPDRTLAKQGVAEGFRVGF